MYDKKRKKTFRVACCISVNEDTVNYLTAQELNIKTSFYIRLGIKIMSMYVNSKALKSPD